MQLRIIRRHSGVHLQANEWQKYKRI